MFALFNNSNLLSLNFFASFLCPQSPSTRSVSKVSLPIHGNCFHEHSAFVYVLNTHCYYFTLYFLKCFCLGIFLTSPESGVHGGYILCSILLFCIGRVIQSIQSTILTQSLNLNLFAFGIFLLLLFSRCVICAHFIVLFNSSNLELFQI